MGAEFGGSEMERKYREAEAEAKESGRGLWKDFKRNGGQGWESPREYKNRMGVGSSNDNLAGKDNWPSSFLPGLSFFTGKKKR